MQAGIYNQPHRAEHFIIEMTEALIGVGVETHREAELLGIERPALDKGGIAAKAHEVRQVGIFLGQRNLEMMARRAFVQIECGNAGGAARRQVIGVEIEDAGTRAVGGAALVGAASLEFFDRFVIGADFERRFRQHLELLANFLVDLLAHVIIGLGQRFSRFRVEFRIGTKMFEKFGQCAVKADLLLDRFHFGLDPVDFAEAEVVDIVGLERQGRRVLDQIFIENVAALHAGKPDFVAGNRQIFILEEIVHALIASKNLLGRGGIFLGQARLVFLAEILGEIFRRCHERAVFQTETDLGGELFDDIVDRQPGFDHAAFHALTEPFNRPVADHDELLVALEIVFVVLHRLELSGTLARGEIGVEGVEAAEMVDRTDHGQRHDFVGIALQRLLLVALEHVIGDLVGGAQLAAVDLHQRCQLCGFGGLFPGEIFVRNIVAELVGIALVAAEQRADRIALQVFLVALGEQGLHLLALGHLGGFVMFHRSGAGRGERLGDSDAAGREEAGTEKKGERFLDHVMFLSKNCYGQLTR